ncbi:MAG: DUF3000 domain-containing protein [Actinomycetales bacterium]|mgnify:CR=1 FL=1|nr:DUF3000 domain-containing protein [Tetrasphaera sp.]NLW99345.1 DUF3000 domain-containing protein [Actinomycetales bacterium]
MPVPTTYAQGVASHSATGAGSAEFAAALVDLRAAALRPEIKVTEVPAPSRIAPYAVALTADVLQTAHDEEALATGRFVLLHDPSEPEPWGGSWRAVTYARAELEPEMATDPVLGDVGWSWLIDALDAHSVEYIAEAGTVTRVVSESYAGLSDRPASVEMEIRASWTPVHAKEIGRHLQAWTDVLCAIGGLPPLPEGVVALPGRRR